MKHFLKKYNNILLLGLVLGGWLLSGITPGYASEPTIKDANGTMTETTLQPIEIYLNGKKISYTPESGEPFVDTNNRTQVPVRQTMTAMGAKIKWEAESQKAVIKLDGNTIEIPLGQYYIVRNGQVLNHDTMPYVANNRMYIPLRVVVEAVAGKVIWEDNAAKITYQKQDTSVKRIPQAFDLREYNRVTPVRDQKQSGACWAFASLGAIESSLMPWEEYDFSEDHMSLGHGYHLSQAQGGDYMIALSYLTRWAGPVLETDDPFGDGEVNTKAPVIKYLQEALFLPKESRIAIKRAILLYGGVQSSLYLDQVHQWGESEYYNEKTASYFYNGDRPINHDIVIVGWDDNYAKENFKKRPENDGAYICKNSFGPEFGLGGYFYISYEDKYIGQNAIAYTKMESVGYYHNIYQSDKLGYLKRAGYGEEAAYFANCFTSKGKEKLKAISFYALEPNTSYEIYVVTDFKSAEDFRKMDTVTKGNFSYAGYYTVKLGQGIPVDGKFSVVVRIFSPGTKHPIATEAKGAADWVGEVDLSDGEGYISFDGKNWKRSEEHLQANVCLKAFTTGY